MAGAIPQGSMRSEVWDLHINNQNDEIIDFFIAHVSSLIRHIAHD